MHIFYVFSTVPNLSVAISHNRIHVLDIAPYNTYTINCTVTQPSSLVIRKTIMWLENPGGTVVTTNGNDINITTYNLNEPTSISSLTARVESTEIKAYVCFASVQPPYDVPVENFASSVVHVKGNKVFLSHAFIISDQ